MCSDGHHQDELNLGCALMATRPHAGCYGSYGSPSASCSCQKYLNKGRCMGRDIYVCLACMGCGPVAHVVMSPAVQIDAFKSVITIIMWVGIIPAGLIGALMSHLRLKFFTKDVAERFR